VRRLLATPEGAPAPALLGPCEQAALGTALALRAAAVEAGRKAKLEVIAVGPEREDELLRYALACGADAALRAWDPALAGTDYYATARVLAAAVRARGFGFVLCGDRSADEALGATGPAVAEFLGVPHLSGARDVRLDGEPGALLASHRGGGFVRALRVRARAVICVADGPRPPAPADVLAAGAGRRKRVQRLDLGRLGLAAEELRYRRHLTGECRDRPPTHAEILSSAEDLVRRLKEDGLI
jgi:electron transfer flavoprotein beta subunit